MNTTLKRGAALLLLLGVAAGGYWYGSNGRIEERGARNEARGMGNAAGSGRTILYYRNPMGLPDTSPVPKKDAMGMDYVPVYADQAQAAGQVSVSPDKVQALGVKSEPAALHRVQRSLRLTGRVEVDERRLYVIAPKFEGWVERLYVNTTGQSVGKGQALFDVYSPDLVSARREHALALQGMASLRSADADAQASMRRLADASAARLKNWDVDAPQSGASSDDARITFRAPASGVVLEKKALQGMRFMPGETLYQIADLSSVWVIADVPEQDAADVHRGSRARVTVDDLPDRTFDGRVDFIYPTLDSTTRTVQVRIVLPNPQGLLKPAMYAYAQITPASGDKVLAVPAAAVIDSGTRQVVLVKLADGRFEPRTVTLGRRNDDYIEITSGIAEGEEVVTSANFLIDSESNLKTALAGFGTPSPAEQAASPAGVAVGHEAQGTLLALNQDGTVSIRHEPIASLGWPGMTMDFVLANPALAANVAPGSRISFEFVERKPGEWVITKLQMQHGGH